MNDVSVSTSSAASPPSTTSNEAASSIKIHTTPDPLAKSTDTLSTWFSPSRTEQIQQPEKAHSDKSTPATDKSGSSNMFGSTWGAGDSFWGSYFGSPGSSEQGLGGGASKTKSSSSEAVKEAPKSTSMARASGSKRSKSQTSSNKTQGSEHRKKATSPRLNSPPKSSSTPLSRLREEKKSDTGDDTGVESSSSMESNACSFSSSRPDQVLTSPTEFESQSMSQLMGKTVVKMNEAEVEKVGSESGGETSTKMTIDENLKSRVTGTPDVSEPLGETKDVKMEATDGFSVTVKSSTLPVMDETDSIKEEPNRPPETSNPPFSIDDSKSTNDVELMRGSSSSEPQPSCEPTATDRSTTERNTTQVPPLQMENNNDHSVVHNQQAYDNNTDTQQTTSEQEPLANQKSENKLTSQETKFNKSEDKSTKQDEKVASRSSTPELAVAESEEVDTKNTVKMKDSTLHQLQTSSSPDDHQTSEPGRSLASVAAQDELEGERRESMAESVKDESTTSEKAVITVERSLEHPDVHRLEKVKYTLTKYMKKLTDSLT